MKPKLIWGRAKNQLLRGASVTILALAPLRPIGIARKGIVCTVRKCGPTTGSSTTKSTRKGPTKGLDRVERPNAKETGKRPGNRCLRRLRSGLDPVSDH